MQRTCGDGGGAEGLLQRSHQIVLVLLRQFMPTRHEGCMEQLTGLDKINKMKHNYIKTEGKQGGNACEREGGTQQEAFIENQKTRNSPWLHVPAPAVHMPSSWAWDSL